MYVTYGKNEKSFDKYMAIWEKLHWVKCDRISNYSDPHFSAFGFNIERKYRKKYYRMRKNTFL